jgi:hypothetical protein
VIFPFGGERKEKMNMFTSWISRETCLTGLALFLLFIVFIGAAFYRIPQDKGCYQTTAGAICPEDFQSNPSSCAFECRVHAKSWLEFKRCAEACGAKPIGINK